MERETPFQPKPQESYSTTSILMQGSFRDSLPPEERMEYDRQMALLEEQNKRRLQAAMQLRRPYTFHSPPPNTPPFSPPKPTIAETQELLEKQHQQWIKEAKDAQANSISGPSFTHGKVSQPSSKSSTRFAPYP